MEWAATGRPRVEGNLWTSCGIANVTGGKFDRVEVKFITDFVISLRSEAEIRLAAFKHSHANQSKTCVAATSTVRLTGNWVGDQETGRVVVGTGKWRWIHGLPRGWNVDPEDEDAIFTIELQHRNPDDCLQTPDPAQPINQVFSFFKKSNEDASRFAAKFVHDKDNAGDIAAGLSWTGDQPSWGWVPIPDNIDRWNGAYSVSNMHYCVGMTAEQIPEASESGWFWYSGGDAEFVRQPNKDEDYMRI